MKFIVFSDLHAHTHQAYSMPTSAGGTTRLLDTIRVLSFIRSESTRTGIKDVLFAGDLFEAKGRVPVVVLNAVYRELDLWRKEQMNLIMIPGNHDLAVRSGDEHALEILQELGMVKVVSSPSWAQWKTSTGEVIGLTVVPFREVLKREWFDVMPNGFGITDQSLRICLAHGVVQDSKFSLDSDVSLSNYTNEALISFSWLLPFDFSIVGHVHLPQVLGSGTKVLIPGQPWQQFPHEYKQNRGIWVVDIQKPRKTICTLHPVPGSPMFIQADLLEDETIVCTLHDKVYPIEQHVVGNIILLTPVSVKTSIQAVHSARDKLLNMGAVYVEVLSLEASMRTDAPRVSIDVKNSPYDILQKTLQSGHVSLQGHSLERISLLGEQILKAVLEKTTSE
jgi:DNA repair exonuclease SbcCD nuclease subunit